MWGCEEYASCALDGVVQNWTRVSSDADEPAALSFLQVNAKLSPPRLGTASCLLDANCLQRLVGVSLSHSSKGQMMFYGTPANEWMVFSAVVLALLLIDTLILQRHNAWKDGFMNNLSVLAFWVCAGLTYNLYFYLRYGVVAATDWCVGYFLEWMLSIDNLFVFHIIFRFYKMPPALMKKALFFGIMGAVLFRMLTFFAIGSLLHIVHWFRKVVGLALIYSAYQAVSDDGDEEMDVSQSYAVRILRVLLGNRLVERLDTPGDSAPMEDRLFIRDSKGRMCMTLTAYVILLLEVTDIFFAIDSVSAKIAQIDSLYVAYTSSILAIFGLRAMFFVIRDLVDYFEMLKYGICTILIFIGVEMMLEPWVVLRSSTVCIVIVSLFAISMLASVIRKLIAKPQQEKEAQDTKERCGWKSNFVPEEVAGSLGSTAATASASSEAIALHQS